MYNVAGRPETQGDPIIVIALLIILAIAGVCFYLALKERCPRRLKGFECKGANCEPGCPDSLMVPPVAGKTIEPIKTETPVKPTPESAPQLVKPKTNTPAASTGKTLPDGTGDKAKKPSRQPKASKPDNKLPKSK